MKNNVYTFTDLEFSPHPLMEECLQAYLTLDEEHSVWVMGGGIGIHGNGTDNFELVIMDGTRQIVRNVYTYLTPQKITEVMAELQTNKT